MNARISVRCDSTALEAGNVKIFALRLPASHGPCHDIDPGRYVALEYADMAGGVQQRMYSVTRKPAPDVFEIAVRRTGTRGVADRLHASLQEGAAVTLLYTGGEITVDAVLVHSQVLMWAGGIGVTLPIALLRELAERAKQGLPVPGVTLYLCCPRVQDVPFLHELLELDLTSAWFDMQVFITRQPIDSGWSHFHAGRPSDDMLRALPEPGAVLLCGGHQFAAETRSRVRDLYPHAELLIESFSAPQAPVPEPAPAAAPSTAARAMIAIAGREDGLPADPARSLLENLEQHGVPIRSQCRSGICGSCRVRILSGDCRREADFCLDDKDVSNGYALACCTYPTAGELAIALGPGN
ncbi:2Fe-2S iron-sulfur cluster binding domain-containing protein [Duganella sp. FT92W]|uniref:2Fe-2S iron-sulfur cluster binding domain-containing protein n=1 Tax=Pseudoduganella rivuli TaxID=2666085 RepID=A0A7X2LU03_9BURK|nr:iron-sulfur cluster-binding domain-containing protein [Pseudoduganella rivuli]MRV75135.1 2Fe-2S iron-sulfur cluster binding domain-containing protein [Pseudoduganella rivuli]